MRNCSNSEDRADQKPTKVPWVEQTLQTFLIPSARRLMDLVTGTFSCGSEKLKDIWLM
jgi:hypothetical protein